MKEIVQELHPVQLGVGVHCGCETIIHNSCHETIIKISLLNSLHILFKLDMWNAFTIIRRDHNLKICQWHVPWIFQLLHLSYCWPCMLIATNNIICTFQPPDSRRVTCSDDATLRELIKTLVNCLYHIIPDLSFLGLEIILSKSEMINRNYSVAMFEVTVPTKRPTKSLRKEFVIPKEELLIFGSQVLSIPVQQYLQTKQVV